MKLIPMTSFVDNVVTADRPCDRGAMLDEIAKYSKFLQRPLTLGMFMPCDLEGNVLEEPESLMGFYESDREGMKQESLNGLINQKKRESSQFKR